MMASATKRPYRWGGHRTDDGDPWLSDTLAMCFNTTKGVASTALHILADRGAVGYDATRAAHELFDIDPRAPGHDRDENALETNSIRDPCPMTSERMIVDGWGR